MKVRILETLHANRDGTCKTFERGEVADLPQGTANCLVRSRKALPIDETDVSFAADVRREQLTSILERHDLSIKLVADHDGLRELHSQYKDLTHRLRDAQEEVQATREVLNALRQEWRNVEDDAPEGTPSRSTIRSVEKELTNAQEHVEALQQVLHTASDHFTEALEDAHRRAEQDACAAHTKLLKEAVSAARTFQDVLSDLVRFEEGFSDRIDRRLGGLPELERWIQDAETLT